MKLQCSFLASGSGDFLGSGAELLIIAQLEPVKGLAPNSRTVAPNPPSCSLFPASSHTGLAEEQGTSVLLPDFCHWQ